MVEQQERSWVRLESWHIEVGSQTRCGLDLTEQDRYEHKSEISVTDRTCENCLRLAETDA